MPRRGQEIVTEHWEGNTVDFLKRITKRIAFLTVCLTIGACASGPRFSEMSGTIPNLAADSGRIYIYRTAVIGAAAIGKPRRCAS